MDIESLRTIIRERCHGVKQVVVALSGGVDSALVAAATFAELGKRAVAVTVRSELTGGREFTRGAEVAEYIGIEHHPLLMRLLKIEGVARNGNDRCYHCKREIFSLMRLEYGDDCLILDGTNADDDPQRPGLRAVSEFGVFSPLKEAGISKEKCRSIAKSLGLKNWNAPSESCLATRARQGVRLTSENLAKIDAMETFFHGLGVETLRASHDNLVATIEYLPHYADIMKKNRDPFEKMIRGIGLRSCIYKEWTP